MTIQRLYATLALAAAALLVAGCGGGNGMGGAAAPPATSAVTKSDTPPPVDTGNGGGAPEAPDMSVSLPDGHGIAEEGEYTIASTATLKVAGVRFSCDGDVACVVTVAVDEDGVVSTTYSGGEPTAAALDATGNQAFENLSAALLVAVTSADLKANLYHDVADVDADADATPGG